MGQKPYEKKEHFTLVEVLIAVIILAVLATLVIPAYFNVVEKARARVCMNNLRALLGAVEAYTLENNSFPGSLSQLRPQDMRKGWAVAFKGNEGWKDKLAYCIVNFDTRGLAYADHPPTLPYNPWIKDFLPDLAVLQCPSDPQAGTTGHYSYGVNKSLEGKTWREYQAVGSDTLVIVDCNHYYFVSLSEAVLRHATIKIGGSRSYALGISRSAAIREID